MVTESDIILKDYIEELGKCAVLGWGLNWYILEGCEINKIFEEVIMLYLHDNDDQQTIFVGDMFKSLVYWDFQQLLRLHVID